ncbi:HD domain-containing protein [Undibacterium crateris]|uniref:HD domain-containing protein n=1 Tax=Undibacterium crateris TaxID=2528175 RepID=UPI00138A26A1|nr:HD domain-containing protein [Undibacterium crateris]NDI85043.1 HD domain-containing protein [Undibacterium crateris]
MNVAYQAMLFAREKHKSQVRKYTGNPYADHLAEVAGIVATVDKSPLSIAASWLHDCVEDQGVSIEEINDRFGVGVASAVEFLSDMEQGNRAERKAASRIRLAAAPGWVQTIKCADMISNTSSIVMHDPKFAVTYLDEKRLLLDVMTKANPLLLTIARDQIGGAA